MNMQDWEQQQHGSAGEPSTGESLGSRLRAEREARGLSTTAVGERLRLPSAIVEAMEREDFDRLGATIYARSHLHGYVRLLGLPPVLVDSALSRRTPPPLPLVTAPRTSRSHQLFDRIARRAVYVVLTASIVLPVVWLATRDQLPGRSTVVETLDSAPVSRASDEGPATGTAPTVASQAGAPGVVDEMPLQPVVPREPTVGERQVVASLAPFYRETEAAPQPPAAPQEHAALRQEPSLRIEFVGPSWVEVIDHGGKRLAFGLVAAGEAQRFPLASVASVSIGDADAVDVSMAGREVDLAPYRRAKVARFTLSSDGELKPAGG